VFGRGHRWFCERKRFWGWISMALFQAWHQGSRGGTLPHLHLHLHLYATLLLLGRGSADACLAHRRNPSLTLTTQTGPWKASHGGDSQVLVRCLQSGFFSLCCLRVSHFRNLAWFNINSLDKIPSSLADDCFVINNFGAIPSIRAF